MKLEIIAEPTENLTWYTIRKNGRYIDSFLALDEAEKKFNALIAFYSKPIPEPKVLKSIEL